MDDFDIEMGDANDVPMEEAEIEDIIGGDDQQVCEYRHLQPRSPVII